MENHAEVSNSTIQSARYRRQSDKYHIPPAASNHRLVIITQLLQIAGNMRHIDELFLWLSHTLVQRLDIQVIQFWANQLESTSPYAPTLRVTVCQNISLPQHVVVNPQVAEVTQRIYHEQRGAMPQAVDSFFPPQQTHLLTCYNLNYWASYFMNSKGSSRPSTRNDLDSEILPFTIAVSLFLRQAPNPHLLPNIEYILEHAMLIARNRGLLGIEIQPTCPISTLKHKAPTLSDLIPQRIKRTNVIQRYNLFSRTMIITNKPIRRLYRTIDGKKSIASLLISTRMETKDFYTALRMLLAKKLIQLRKPNGQLVENTPFLKIP